MLRHQNDRYVVAAAKGAMIFITFFVYRKVMSMGRRGKLASVARLPQHRNGAEDP